MARRRNGAWTSGQTSSANEGMTSQTGAQLSGIMQSGTQQYGGQQYGGQQYGMQSSSTQQHGGQQYGMQSSSTQQHGGQQYGAQLSGIMQSGTQQYGGQPYSGQSNVPQSSGTHHYGSQSSMSQSSGTQQYGGQQYGAQRQYENAVEPTHNGNFAWNGQPVPDYSSRMPEPGSSGDMSAPYGQRNTGINHADARNVGFQGGYTGYGANGQPTQYGTFMRDGTQYGKGPHTIDPNKEIISAVRYGDGGISAVRFQDGTVADIAQAIGMAEAGLIEDVNVGRNREGQKTLRSYPDGDPSNNLSNLPRF